MAREKFLDAECASDAPLRAEVDSLLLAGDALSPGFLESPLAGLGAETDGPVVAGLTEGQIFAERFRLIRQLGQGGMGQVWLAQQLAPVLRPVALKLIKAGMYDETVVQRFQSERQSLAIMDHPAIAKVFDAGATAQGQPYLAMEYVPGLPISDYCDQQRLNVRRRVELFIQACDGVQHAHQKAIIHRDLKPANILVLEVDGKPVPRIIDFGLAKTKTAAMTDQPMHTLFGQFIGTPGYMSPERVDPKMEDIDTRADVYSLGVILYELLTGLQPFEIKKRQRPSLEEWLRQLREEEPPRPSAKVSADQETAMPTAAARDTVPQLLVKALRGDLDWITLKALERDRERRYGTPAELAAELRRYLNDEPVIAHAHSSAYRFGKFIRRHRLAATVAGMVTALAIAASGAGLLAVRKQHEAEYQTAQALQAQSRLLIQAAAQRLKDSDLAGAQGIILEVLRNPAFSRARTPAAISVFQEMRAADAQLAVLSGHEGRVEYASYSPDGRCIVTAATDNTSRIWDARTGAQLVVLSGHRNYVRTALYSKDGSQVVTAGMDKSVRLWDAHTGAPLAAFSGHGALPISAAFSPDAARLVVASLDGTARIWDAHSGDELAVLRGHSGALQFAEYSPDGTRIVTSSRDKTARIWEARSGATLSVLSGHGGIVLSATFSPDGTQVVTTSADKTARTWDARTGAPLLVLSGHSDRLYSARYSPDGTRIVTASDDKTARIWDASSGAPLAVLSGHGGFVRAAEYSPDGTRIVTASDDGTARTWRAREDAEIAVLRGHKDGVAFANFSPDGMRIVTASLDKTLEIWDARTDAPIGVFPGNHDYFIAVTYSPDGKQLATGGYLDNSARLWDAHTGAPLAALTGHAGLVESVAYSPDGSHISTASLDKTARIWDAHSGKPITVLSGHGDRVLFVAYSPDGKQLATASFDKTARIWDARSGAQLLVLSGHAGAVTAVAFSPDGGQVVTASFDKTARIWDARSGATLFVLTGHAGPIQSVGYSSDGSRIVTASSDKTARIWDAHSGTQLAVLPGHEDSLQSAAFSPSGLQIVTGSLDKTARVWEARVPGSLDAQILFEAAAASDPLAEADRSELGVPPDTRVHVWPMGSNCDQAAASVYDPDRVTPGVLAVSINVDIAARACSAEIAKPHHGGRLDYEMGRVLAAKADAAGARQLFEVALVKGYRAAGLDLGDLLASDRSIPLYKSAWQAGVSMAAARLGDLYERGIAGSKPSAGEAWLWYRRGADAGEPNALARFAQREEMAALEASDSSTRNAQLLRAFALYANAAMQAREAAWPDDAWRHWRYRQASLARVLAHEGMMQQVAYSYAAVLARAPAPTQKP
ncbi:MAG: protein kinase [Steroidobacteraceae bacterium]